MNLCYLTRQMTSIPIEGHHVVSKRIIEAATSVGVKSQIISIESSEKQLNKSREMIIIESKIRSHRSFLFLPGIINALDDLFSSVQSSIQIRSLDIDLLHILNVNKESSLLVNYLFRLDTPILLHLFHSPHVLSDDVFWIRKLAFKFHLYNHSSIYILTMNRSLHRYLVEKAKIDMEHVHYLPCPVDTERFKPLDKDKLREEYGISFDQTVLVYIGSLNPARGLFDLVKSLHRFTNNKSNVVLYISHPQRIGEEEYEKYLYSLIQNLGLQKNVIVKGISKKIEEVYNLADIVVLPFTRPYWVDPPLVLLEAMSCGLPVVTTDIGALSELVIDNKNGILLSKPQVLFERVLRLLENPKGVSKIGLTARKTILQNHSYQVVGDKLLKIYNSILS